MIKKNRYANASDSYCITDKNMDQLGNLKASY